MTVARFSFTTMLGLSIAMASVQISCGQILGAEAAPASAAVQQAGGAADELGEIKQTSWPSIPLPKITMPEITLPRLWPSTEDDRPALLAPFVVGASKVSEGVKKAWEGTKDIFSVGAGKSSSTAPASSRQERPSIWKRLVGRSPKKTIDDGPQTVGEFMSQKRLNP